MIQILALLLQDHDVLAGSVEAAAADKHQIMARRSLEELELTDSHDAVRKSASKVLSR